MNLHETVLGKRFLEGTMPEIARQLKRIADALEAAEAAKAEEVKSSWYFTFGTDPGFPFERGWVEVIAASEKDACEIFRSQFPDRSPGVLNCAFVYDGRSFNKERFVRHGETCHAILCD